MEKNNIAILKFGIPLAIIVSSLVAAYIFNQNLVLPILTFLTIIVALFKEKFLDFFFSPNLMITVSKGPAHFHEADAVDPRNGSFIEKQFWLGARVENIGIGNARNVEVFFKGVDSNIIEAFSSYSSIPLRRGWTGGSLVQKLPPKIPLRWDICLLHGASPRALSFSFTGTPNALNRIQCIPKELSYFEFYLITIADNARTKKLKVRVEFRGEYNQGFEVRII